LSTVNAEAFDYRFSTKPQDAVTGLYYYGRRDYEPVTGRWPSRDPIEEKASFNLYAMVRNNPIYHWDYLGLAADLCLHGPGVCGNPKSNPSLLKDSGVAVFTVVGHGLPAIVLDQRGAPADMKDEDLQVPGKNGVKMLSGKQLAEIIESHQNYVIGKTCTVELYICYGGARTANGGRSLAEEVKRVLLRKNPKVQVMGGNNKVFMTEGKMCHIGPTPDSIPGCMACY